MSEGKRLSMRERFLQLRARRSGSQPAPDQQPWWNRLSYKMRVWKWRHIDAITYRLSHAVFRWVQDDDGDIGLEVFRIVTFIKYKEHTVIYWFRKYPPAPKYIG